MEGMLEHGSLLVTAWDAKKIVGMARAITDFHYACWLSELAVDQAYQRSGIGKQMVNLVRDKLGPHCKLRLAAAPAAADYYSRIGFQPNQRCWEILPDQLL